ncbi:hypothetical protein CTI14_64225, partial [Methylobacterium radiotolerans]
RTEPTPHRVAGRECRLITIEPLDKLRYGYRLCAERRRGDRFPGLLLGDAANLSEHYKIRTEPTPHRVAGRECRLITIEPLDKLRYGYRLCA